MINKSHSSSGKISTTLLVLGVMLLVLIIAVFVFLRINAVRNGANNPDVPAGPIEPEKPVYEATLGDIRFVFQSAQDLGSVIQSQNSYQQELTTTERFIKVTIAGQNKGKIALDQGNWDVGNIIDSEGRIFSHINNQAYGFIPGENYCEVGLKPEFQPTPCIRLYEVSRESTGLKVQIISGVPRFQEGLLDMVIR